MSDVLPLKPIGPTVSWLASSITDGFDLGEPRIGVRIIERAEQLFLRVQIARRAVAADADADGARAAAFALRFPHRVEDAFAHPLERPVGAAEMIEIGRQRVLRVRVLAAAALQDQFDLDVGLLPTDRSE